VTPVRALLTVLVAALIALTTGSATADIFSRILQSAERAGGKAVRSSAGQLDDALNLARRFEVPQGGAALAAHVDQHGTWIFINKAGERFTAASPDEVARAVPSLAPNAEPGKLVVVLSQDAVVRHSAALRQLPDGADLRLATNGRTYRVTRLSGGSSARVHVRENLVVETHLPDVFAEAIWQLERPLRRAAIRVLALDSQGPRVLASAPRIDPVTRRAITDRIAPDSLAGALSKIKGQMAILVGRVVGDRLYYRAGDATEHWLSLSAVQTAARDADANLLILQSNAPRQPGIRNWLWQRAAVTGLDEALGKATLADFLNAVAASNSSILRFTVQQTQGARITFSATPVGRTSAIPSFGLDGVMTEALAEITAQIAATAVSGEFRDRDRQRELDMRIIPGIPSDFQIAYFLAMFAGLIGLAPLLQWWKRLWPPELRQEYAGRTGYIAARTARLLCFVFLFMPIAGMPAAIVALLMQILGLLLLPVRVISWIIGRGATYRV
jgi:hypothetical protein